MSVCIYLWVTLTSYNQLITAGVGGRPGCTVHTVYIHWVTCGKVWSLMDNFEEDEKKNWGWLGNLEGFALDDTEQLLSDCANSALYLAKLTQHSVAPEFQMRLQKPVFQIAPEVKCLCICICNLYFSQHNLLKKRYSLKALFSHFYLTNCMDVNMVSQVATHCECARVILHAVPRNVINRNWFWSYQFYSYSHFYPRPGKPMRQYQDFYLCFSPLWHSYWLVVWLIMAPLSKYVLCCFQDFGTDAGVLSSYFLGTSTHCKKGPHWAHRHFGGFTWLQQKGDMYCLLFHCFGTC